MLAKFEISLWFYQVTDPSVLANMSNVICYQEDVESFMKNPENESGAAVLQRLDEQLNKYRFMDANLQQKKKRLVTRTSAVDKTDISNTL